MRRRSLVAVALLSIAWLSSRTATAQESSSRPSSGTVVRGLAGGGASVATLFGISSTALHLDAGVGIQKERSFFPLTVNAELGQTPNGLSAGEITAGAATQWVIGRARLGAGLDLGYGWIGRAPTSIGPHIGMYALDAFALATLDVIDLGDHRALYLGVRPSVGLRWGEGLFAWSHDAVTWRGAALTGIRF
ncbi:hypothetical protein BH11MYX4_BH11MYX4_13420 [soil metagenome]